MFSLIPGMGQMYNKQYGKGALFFLFGVSFFIVFYDLFNIGFWGLFTLGTMLPRDNSVFLLAKGIIALLTAGFGIGFYVLMMRDAFMNGKKRDQGVPLHSIRAQYHQLIDQGFPYLMSTPAFFLLLFSVVFPIMFSFALAFTNYDL